MEPFKINTPERFQPHVVGVVYSAERGNCVLYVRDIKHINGKDCFSRY